MSGAIAPEITGDSQSQIRLPRTASRRGAVTYCQVVERVVPDPVWGGWRFEGRLFRPGSIIPVLPENALLLECAGPLPGGSGHNRAPCLYVLWRLDDGAWRELARAATIGRDWTIGLGPIAKAELDPPRPVLIDPESTARRLLADFEREIEPMELRARVLVVRAVQDRLAAAMAG